MSKDITQLEASNYKARSIARGRLLERFRDTVQEIVDHADNEGDRVYFGTTNHFEVLKDIAQQMESWNWDRLAHERREIDPYAEMRACRKEVAESISSLAAKDAEIAKLREALSEAVKHLEGEPEYHDQGMGCGLEDRGITDRYVAMQHGWEQAMERVYGENIAWAKDTLSAALAKAGEA